MNCSELDKHLDDHLDGGLDDETGTALVAHLAACADCRLRVDHAMQLQSLLKRYGRENAPQADEGFFDRALIRAAHQGARKQRNRWVMTGFGGAIAAGLVMWLLGGVLLQSPELAQPGGIPQVTMALEEPRTINLVFSSAEDLDGATLTVNLPDGLELAGFRGQREVTWMTSLTRGKNVLPLKLIATMPRGGELLATLRHEDDDRSFRLQVTVI